ncbi:SDR family NAD(P)-dependent oxidoreductase [Actinomadura monticuli]|uniref:SDR family NAD(P)-dependent oxidoreductase n=1 Tax=Actinomadura monticuli TaxID=3097367 RepID=A0ABV4Q558_9ACTN
MSSTEDRLRQYLKRVTVDLGETRERLHEIEERDREPMAVIGMACRFPGGVGSPEDLWDLVAAGRDAVSGFPANRGWDLQALYHPDPDHPGTTYAREGGFLDGADLFDAAFFGISPREAAAMEPQQRVLLETAWQALERAGIDPASLRATPTGAFVGAGLPGFGTPHTDEQAEGYLLTGNALSVLSGRVAYTLGLEGPAVTVDTACSSSLVAIHLACQSLRRGECSLALAGGVTVLSTPGGFTEFSRQRGLSPDGRCKSFAAAADGTGFAEGVGLVVLERLSDARRNGHRVLAVVRGSAINQDGASNGLTAPNGPSQRRVIRAALAGADLSAAEVDAVEAHGTGTTLGDPIEADALLATYGRARSADRPLWLGSIKSNIGHAQGAAGVAGVIKMVMALRHGTLPATLHVDEPSPHVDWSAGEVRLLTGPVDWPDTGRPRRAGVSAFGMSGTNAHVIVEQAPDAGPDAAPEAAPGDEPAATVPWVVSAKSGEALRAQAGRLAEYAQAVPDLPTARIGWSLIKTRSVFEHRAVVVGDDQAAALAALAEGEAHPDVVVGEARAVGAGPVLVFPGQGSQWAGMGARLLEGSAVFASRIAECEQALDPYVEWSLAEVLRGDGSELSRVDVVQPVLWAVMVSLAAVWAEYGVTPAAVVGHSQGEIAAACVAGALSIEDAAKVVAIRSKALRRLSGGGAMASLGVGEEQAAQLLEAVEDVTVAAVNGPASTVVSGPPEQVAAVVAAAQERDLRARMIDVDYASHGPQVDQIADELNETLDGITPTATDVAFYSTVTAGRLDTDSLDASYWVTNLRRPVRFADTVTTLLADGYRAFVESSPHPVLTPGIEGCADQADIEAVALSTLRRDHGGDEEIVRALAGAFTAGVEVDWARRYPADPAPALVDLPTYAFQRTRFPLPSGRCAADPAGLGLIDVGHPVLGAAVEAAETGERLLTGRVSRQALPWLADHEISGHPLVPGAALVEWALRAADETGCPGVEELVLHTPTVLPPSGDLTVQVAVGGPDGDGRREIRIHSRPGDGDGAWVRQATGFLGDAPAHPAPDAGEAWPPQDAEPVDIEHLYDEARAAGYDYGPAFQGVRALWRRGDDLFAEVRLPDAAGAADGFGVHPALLDAALHPLLPTAAHEDGTALLPFSWTGVTLHAAAATALRVTVSPLDGGRSFRLSAADPAGAPVLDVEAMTVRPAETADIAAAARDDAANGLFVLEWTPHRPASREASGDWLELDDLEKSLEAGAAAPSIVVAPVDASGGIAASERVLALLQGWLADPRLAESRLVLVTCGAVATDDPDPDGAAVWGLVRSAQAEHPGRFTLIDADADAAADLAMVVESLDAAEPQLAIRAGTPLVPRLDRAGAADGTAPPGTLDPDGTVLVVGGTGVLGGRIAEHLVRSGRARRLLLASRRGTRAPGAAELARRLTDLGADVEIAALDVTDPAAVSDLVGGVGGVGGIDPAHPLTGVVHAAGLLDDAVITSQTPEKLARAWAVKAGGAANLHAATEHLPLGMFVLFSSAAAILGSPGQAGYAAANAFCDALARRRRDRGLAGLSVAWGLWAESSGMTGGLTDTDLARMRRGGMTPLPTERALALFEAALRSGRPGLLAAGLDPRAIPADDVPAILRRLAGRTRRRAAAGAAEADGLARLAPEERRDVLTGLVLRHAATVLGHASPDGVSADVSFKDLGLDSLTAVQLRNGLATATGLRLPATLVFDHPTPRALGEHLASRFAPAKTARAGAAPARAAARPDEPVAIVSMACRYPGGVSSPEDLWRLLSSGRDAVGEFPADRGWDLGSLFHPDPDHPGTTYARHGGFLADAMLFDAEFFGVNPREALAADPQQRLMLEAAWEVFERAGIAPAELKGTPTGVYTGLMYHDYGTGTAVRDARLEGYGWLTGSGSVLSGRVAFTFGLEGPAVTVDTACSSSLVATHLACQALRQGECSLALAGGVTVMATPDHFVDFARQRGLARDGRCKAFAASADGTGLSEGLGLVLLERLSDARRNGHRVLATIRGSAVNQDGASNGLTAPNGPAQERVIRTALASAGVRPADVDAVEAHGTGTPLGDPIEAQAVLATYGADRPGDRPLWLGSVKSNIGHTQGAAGVAGLIKMVMALRHGVLPTTLHVDEPSPHVDWTSGAVRLLTEPVPWDGAGRPRRAAISSFGASGTNAHVIVEEAAEEAEPEAGRCDPVGVVPWVVSARGVEALRAQAVRLKEFAAASGASVVDVGWSLLRARSLFEHRLVAVGSSCGELVAGLGAADPVEPVEGGSVWLFSGQGSQRVGMGAGLYERFPVFAETFDEVCGLLDPYLEHPLRQVVFEGPAEVLDHTTYAQAGLFALQIALARLLADMGLRPDALVGHSIGEVAAAHLAGVFDLADACRLVGARATLMGALPAGGAMLAVQAGADELTVPDGVSIASFNTADSSVVSGPEDLVAEVEAHWSEHGRKTKRLSVSHAFHSVLMEPMLEEFAAALGDVSFGEPVVPLVSTLTGEPAGSGIASPEYWVRQVREPVRFHPAITHLADRAGAFLELGPDPVLSTAAQNIADDAVALAALKRDQPDTLAFAQALARLHGGGVDVDWTPWFPTEPRPRVIDLPTYAFQGERFWLGGRERQGPDTTLEGADGRYLLSGEISAGHGGWPAEHVIGGSALLPGTALLGWALRAADESGCSGVEELTLQAPLVLPRTGGLSVQVAVGTADESGRRDVQVHSRQDGEWLRHASGTLTSEPVADVAPMGGPWPPAGAVPLDVAGFYADAAAAGYEYGPSFQGLRAAWRDGEDLLAEVVLPEAAGEATGHGLHPALLDAALHPLLADQLHGGALWLPFAWSGVVLHADDASAIRVRLSRDGERVRLVAADTAGAPVVTAESVLMRPADPGGFRGGVRGLFALEWPQGPEPHATAPEDCTVVEAATVDEALRHVRDWLPASEPDGDRRLVIVTRGAVGESPDPDGAAVWGLVRSAQAEHPGRFVLVDLDEETDTGDVARYAVEPQVAVRDGGVLVPRLVRAGVPRELAGPVGERAWRLVADEVSTLDDVSVAGCPEVLGPLAAGQVRIDVYAAGVNFRDVLIGLGMVPGFGGIGGEGAGVVTEVGPDVTGLAPGDRVMGVFGGAFGPVAVADARSVVPMPEGWSFGQAAGVGVAFLTAWFGLVDLAELGPGQTVLVHAATGGVGRAAVQIAGHLGAEVYATASPGKHVLLEEMGIDEAHRASSRDLDFEDAFRAATGGRGVDVVLNSLAGEFTDASLRLLAGGGRFLEMGKTDIRSDPGVWYRAFDLAGDVPPERIESMLAELRELFVSGGLEALPVQAWPLGRAREALRFMSQARHTGKLVLDIPAAFDPDGTVLITGGTGTLGALTAHHLARAWGARHLLLVSRRGPDAPGAAELADQIPADVRIEAADIGDPDAVGDLIEGIDPDHPLTGVIHAAGVIDDGLITDLTPRQMTEVWKVKADGAANLDAATTDHRLAFFTVFSSAAGTTGSPGQANYAAANAYCDALMARRRAAGLPGQSIGWGPWEETSAMTARLTEADLTRMRRGGLRPLTSDHGLALFDGAAMDGRARLVAFDLDTSALRDEVPEVMRELAAGPVRRPAAANSRARSGELAARLAAAPPEERHGIVLELVLANAATALGHPDTGAVHPETNFKDLGFDSLTAVELRNRLSAATGLRLPAALVFDYPDPAGLAGHLLERLGPDGPAPSGHAAVDAVLDDVARLEGALAALAADPGDGTDARAVTARLEALLGNWKASRNRADGGNAAERLEIADTDQVLDFIDNELGLS